MSVGIFAKPETGKATIGFAGVTANADEHTGTFRLSASGAWDGPKLER